MPVDCLISFHSKGFPLEKAIRYAQLRNCYVLNNLPMQFDIQDRRKVYSILEEEGIEIPRYAVLDRDSQDPKLHELVESEDHVEINGVIFNKPFVEKPVSAEDHNIYIYCNINCFKPSTAIISDKDFRLFNFIFKSNIIT